MENILQSIVLGQKETSKAIEEQTKLLGKIYKIEEARADIEKRKLNEDKASKRRSLKSSSDSGLLRKVLGDPKKKGKDGGILGGMFGMIGKLLMGLGGLGILKALGITAIGGTIAAYFSSPEFRSFVNEKIMKPVADAMIAAASGLGGIIKQKFNDSEFLQRMFGGSATNKNRPFSTSQAQYALDKEKYNQRQGLAPKDQERIKQGGGKI